MSLSDIFAEIEAERVRQIEVKGHTPEADDALSPGDWLLVALRWLGMATNCGVKVGRPDLYRHRMLQVAAIAIASVEACDRQSAELANSAVGQGDVPPAMPEPPVVPVCLSSVG